jgi:hypothetical protein
MADILPRQLRAADSADQGDPNGPTLRCIGRRLRIRVGAIDRNRRNRALIGGFVPAVDAPAMRFRCLDHWLLGPDGPIGNDSPDSLGPAGLVSPTWCDSGVRLIDDGVRPARRPAGLRGRRIRVQREPFRTAIGAVPEKAQPDPTIGGAIAFPQGGVSWA